MKNETKEMTCTEAYEQYKKFVYQITYKFNIPGQSMDDLIQIGCIGLIKAFNTYQYERNIMFITYLAVIVNNEMKMSLRRSKKNDAASLDCEMFNDNGDITTLLDIVSDPVNFEELIVDSITFKEIESLLNELTSKQRSIIRCRYFNDMSQREIAGKFNITQSYISRTIQKALKILKNKHGR